MVQLRRTSRKTQQRRKSLRELRRNQDNSRNSNNRNGSNTNNRRGTGTSGRNNGPSGESFQDSSNNNENGGGVENDGDDTLVDFLRVAVEDTSSVPLHQREYTGNLHRYQTYAEKLLYLVLKYGLMVLLMTMNFIALSLSLNCNVDQEFFTRIFSAIFAFFFGFVYILVNYYTYRVLGQGKICKCDKVSLFPFKI